MGATGSERRSGKLKFCKVKAQGLGDPASRSLVYEILLWTGSKFRWRHLNHSAIIKRIPRLLSKFPARRPATLLLVA
jgi:hypothetical protein